MKIDLSRKVNYVNNRVRTKATNFIIFKKWNQKTRRKEKADISKQDCMKVSEISDIIYNVSFPIEKSFSTT
jgi:methyl coenzyme M reductase alpha subunit